jgi:hypothetical protein
MATATEPPSLPLEYLQLLVVRNIFFMPPCSLLTLGLNTVC